MKRAEEKRMFAETDVQLLDSKHPHLCQRHKGELQPFHAKGGTSCPPAHRAVTSMKMEQSSVNTSVGLYM